MNIQTPEMKYAIWLVPCQSDHDVLAELIASYSKRFTTSNFAPHATLCSGTCPESYSHLTGKVNSISQHCGQITTEIKSIEQSENRFTFFYLKLNTHPLTSIFERAKKSILNTRLPEVGPHVSLIYGNDHSNIDRDRLKTELQGTFPSSITFDRIALVTPKDENWEEIENWKIGTANPLQR